RRGRAGARGRVVWQAVLAERGVVLAGRLLRGNVGPHGRGVGALAARTPIVGAFMSGLRYERLLGEGSGVKRAQLVPQLGLDVRRVGVGLISQLRQRR